MYAVAFVVDFQETKNEEGPAFVDRFCHSGRSGYSSPRLPSLLGTSPPPSLPSLVWRKLKKQAKSPASVGLSVA
jgi:hypothetical protein